MTVVVLAVFAPLAHSTPTIVVGDYRLLPNQAGQQIPIYVSGGDAVQGLDFNVQIGDGGMVAGGFDNTPIIESVDILTGIFAANHTGQTDGATPLLWTATTTTDHGTVTADGLLAVITLSTVGTAGGYSRTLALSPAEEFGGATNFAGIPIDITNGTIHVVPEPSATVLVLSAILALCLARSSKRRSRRQ
jgi:hypothetical protein